MALEGKSLLMGVLRLKGISTRSLGISRQIIREGPKLNLLLHRICKWQYSRQVEFGGKFPKTSWLGMPTVDRWNLGENSLKPHGLACLLHIILFKCLLRTF